MSVRTPRRGLALAEVLIVVALAGVLLSLSLTFHMLQPGASQELREPGLRPSAPAAPVSIHGLSISSARNTVLLRELSGSARLCDLATGRDLPFTLPFDQVTSVAQSENGNVLAVGYRDGMLAIGRHSQPDAALIEGEHSTVTALVCSPDGALIVSADDSGRIRASNSDGTRRWQTQGHSGRAEWLALAPHTDVLASAGADGEIRLWKADSGECLRTLTGHAWKVTRMAFTDNGRRLLSGSLDRTIRLWDVQTGRALWTSPRQEGPILGLACAPGEPVFAACCCHQGRLRLWSLETLRPFAELAGHTEGIRCLQFSPDSQLLFSAGYDGRLKTWRLSLIARASPREDGPPRAGDAQFLPTIGAELTRRARRVRAARWLFRARSIARTGARRPS